MKPVIAVIFLTLLLTVSTVGAKTLNSIVAVVNSDVITSYQLDRAILKALSKRDNPNQLTSAQFDNIKAKVLKSLVSEKLLQQRIEILGLKVSAAELEGAVGDVQRKNGLTRDELEQALVSQGMSMPEYEKQIETEILRYRLLGHEVKYKVMVTTREAREYFDLHRSDYDTEPKVRINRLSFTVPVGDEAELVAFNKRVSVSRDLLLSGETFDQVLDAQGNTAKGSKMGLVAEVDLAETIREALSDVEAGGVSEPVAINGKVHLFHVVERVTIEGDPFDFYRDEIEEKLKREKTDIRFEEWQRELRENAMVEIRI